jgi:hypothetical protein
MPEPASVAGAAEQLDAAIDLVLDALEQGQREGVDLNPLESIIRRLHARGEQLDLAGLPPIVQMLVAGMGEAPP